MQAFSLTRFVWALMGEGYMVVGVEGLRSARTGEREMGRRGEFFAPRLRVTPSPAQARICFMRCSIQIVPGRRAFASQRILTFPDAPFDGDDEILNIGQDRPGGQGASVGKFGNGIL